MTNKIIICRADELVGKVAAVKPAAVLSIEHPGVAEDEKGYAPRLKNGPPQMILTFWDVEARNVSGGPDIKQVEQGLAFAMENILKGDVIIHCQAGISRSVAMALGVLSLLHPHEDEKALVQRLLALRPEAAPNLVVVEMVDKLTGRNGKLVQAVKNDPTILLARFHAELSRQKWAKENPEKLPRRKFGPDFGFGF